MVKGVGFVDLHVRKQHYEDARALLDESATRYAPEIGPWKRWLILIVMGGLFFFLAVLLALSLDDITAGVIAGIAGLCVLGSIVYFLLPHKSSKS